MCFALGTSLSDSYGWHDCPRIAGIAVSDKQLGEIRRIEVQYMIVTAVCLYTLCCEYGHDLHDAQFLLFIELLEGLQ